MQIFSQPPILRGTEKEQLVQMRQYLYRISLDLNVALSNLTADNFAPGSTAAQILGSVESGSASPTNNKALAELKSLIIKTAEEVRAEIDVIETTLESTYVAKSDYGTFTEEIRTQMTATAESVQQSIAYQATLEDRLNGITNEFDQYVIETSGYIRQGIVKYENGVPIIGIAIGQDIQVSGTDIKDGREYEVIDTSSNMSIWTPDKLAFYINGMEAAYVSNGAFYVADIYVLARLFIGQRDWAISAEDGFSIDWIGD